MHTAVLLTISRSELLSWPAVSVTAPPTGIYFSPFSYVKNFDVLDACFYVVFDWENTLRKLLLINCVLLSVVTAVSRPTFAGADGLQHHFGSSALMQPSLLIQQLLLLHLLLLQTQNQGTASTWDKTAIGQNRDRTSDWKADHLPRNSSPPLHPPLHRGNSSHKAQRGAGGKWMRCMFKIHPLLYFVYYLYIDLWSLWSECILVPSPLYQHRPCRDYLHPVY